MGLVRVMGIGPRVRFGYKETRPIAISSDNGTIKFEKKKIKEPLYVIEELSNLILELHNVIIEPSNLRNK